VPGDGIDQNCNGVDACYEDLDGDGLGGTEVVELTGGDFACLTAEGESAVGGDPCDTCPRHTGLHTGGGAHTGLETDTDTDTDTDSDTDTDADTDSDADPDAAALTADPGCGCAAGPPASGLPLALLLLAARRRTR
jgi:MYXO-CTERM domain-containing protein